MFGERFVGDEVFDQLDDLEALAGRELEKGAQQAETLDCTGCGCTELEMQFSREIEVFHLAPMTGSALRVGHQTPIEDRMTSPTMATTNSGTGHPADWRTGLQILNRLGPTREVAVMPRNNPPGKPNRKA